MKGLSESLWGELANEGIGVTSVHPGALKTEMIQATFDESNNAKFAQRSYNMTRKMGMDPSKTAAKILRAVKKKKIRVRLGRDAMMLDILKRLLPTVIHRPMRGLMYA